VPDNSSVVRPAIGIKVFSLGVSRSEWTLPRRGVNEPRRSEVHEGRRKKEEGRGKKEEVRGENNQINLRIH
jgi:hypothetical protein